jgi:hemoglobin
LQTPGLVRPTKEPLTDFQRIGGAPAVTAVVGQFYERVLADPQLASYFEGVDMRRLRRHQVQMISQVLGGPVTYEGADLKTAHAGMAITPSDYRRVTEHLVATLKAVRVDPEIIDRVVGVLAAVEPDVVHAQ